jgi:hypothetical protein
MIKYYLAAVCSLLFAVWPKAVVCAEPLHPTVKSVEVFFQSLAPGKTTAALDRLFGGSPMRELKPQALALLSQQIETPLNLYGKVIGAELLKEEDVSPSLRHVSFLLKQELMPTHWSFTFYKPKDKWVLVWITFNDQVQNVTTGPGLPVQPGPPAS